MAAEHRALAARNRELTELNERLVESERRYREVFENITAGIVVLEAAEDGRFRVISANPAVRGLTGIHESIAEGRFLDELVSEETASRLSEGYRRCIENGSPISVENTLEFPSGRRTYTSTLVPVRNAAGRIHRIIALPIDTTERRIAEEALRESENRYREVFENSSTGIGMLEAAPDGKFRIVSLNPAVGRLTGIDPSVVEGRFLEEALPKHIADTLAAMYRRCVDAGRPIEVENTLEFPAGRRTYFSTLVPIRDAEGRVHRIIALATDVTEQRAAEEALRESEGRYREVFETTSDGIFIVEVTPEQRYRLLAMNPAQARMLGVDEEGVLGRFVEEYTPREAADSLIADNRACIEAGRPLTFERTLDLPEGRRYFSTILIPVKDERGVTRRLIGVARDITEAKRAAEREREHEQQLFHAAKLVSLGTLVSGIAHEINNPNNFIRLNSQNLREFWQDVREILDQAAERDRTLSMHGIPYGTARGMIEDLLAGIEEGSKRIEKLLINLRDYARGDEGELTERVDLNEVIGSAVMIVRDLIGKSTRSFLTRLAPSLPAVRGNYHQLEQVVLNLVTNACQALRSREGVVTVATAVEAVGGAVLLEVTDEGIGIPEADLERVADPFFTTKRAQGGSGLGLAVSSRIVQNHGGTMRFISQQGRGTTARILLPAAGAAP